MGNQNSLTLQMMQSLVAKSIQDLHLMIDRVTGTTQPIEVERDVATAIARLSNEGIPFATKTLPAMGKHLDRILSEWHLGLDGVEILCPDCGTHFLKRFWSLLHGVMALSHDTRLVVNGSDSPVDREPTPMEVILGTSVLSEYFTGQAPGKDPQMDAYRRLERGDGTAFIDTALEGSDWKNFGHLHVDTDGFRDIVRIARTVFYLLYKLEVPFTSEEEAAAEKRFVDTDDECLAYSHGSHNNAILERMKEILGEALAGFNWKHIHPKHGPGAVATGEKCEGKWSFSDFYPTLNREYPYYEFMYGIRTNSTEPATRARRTRKYLERSKFDLAVYLEQSGYFRMKRHDVPVSKLVLVPKDSRGPRAICTEPLALMFIQQGIMSKLVDHIEHGRWTAGHVNFTDQTINRTLALLSSKPDGFYATLDLKDASDRVSWQLIRDVMPEEALAPLAATRSLATLLPSGRVVPLNKYAPMGSALCFPIEALVFWAACVAALAEGDYEEWVAREDVYVYGDDIIVPNMYATRVTNALESIGLQVNRDKSYSTGWFRESCGCDAFLGRDITPVRIKKQPGLAIPEGTAHEAWCSYSDSLQGIGMELLSAYVAEHVESVLGPIPRTSYPTSFISFVRPDAAWELSQYPEHRLNARLQRVEVKVYSVTPKSRECTLTGPPRLLRALIGLTEFEDPNRVVERGSTKMAKKWCSLTHHSSLVPHKG